MLLRGDGGTGYIRVDWFTPDGLPTWGDGRLTILGTEGYIELRKYVDIAGAAGSDHLFLVDARGRRATSTAPTSTCPTAGTWSTTSSTAPRRRCRRPTPSRPPALALLAEAKAARLGHLR